MTFWLAPGNPVELSTTAASTGRDRDDDNQTGPESMVAPLHPNNLSVTTSGSVRPVTGNGLVVYARPDVERDKKRKTWSDLGKENPTKPIGMGTASDGPYNNGDALIQRNDNQGYKTLKRKKHTEWVHRKNLNLVENFFSGLAQKVKGTLTRTPLSTMPQKSSEPAWTVVKPGTSKKVTGQRVSQRLGSVTQKSDKPFELSPSYNDKEASWIPDAWSNLRKDDHNTVNPKTTTARLPKVIGDPEDTKMPINTGNVKLPKFNRTPLKSSTEV